MFQKSSVPFFTNANSAQKFFSIKCFFSKEWGQALCACVGPPGPPPFFEKKTFYWKELLCTVWICKKWDWRFLKHLAVLTFCICACLSICSLQKKIEFVSFALSYRFQKSGSVPFLLVRSSDKKMYPCFDFEFEKDEVHLVCVSFKSLQSCKNYIHVF